MDDSRRGFLKRGATLAGTGGLVAVSGCSSLPVVGGDGGSSAPAYAQWLPAADAVGDDYRFFSARPVSIMERADSLPKKITKPFERSFGLPGIGKLKTYDRLLNVAGLTILKGELNKSKVKGGLEKFGVTPEKKLQGYQLFTSSADGRSAALAGDVLILGGAMGSQEKTLSTVKAVVKAKAGVANRYHESDTAVGTLVENVADGDVVQGVRHAKGKGIEGATAGGLRLSLGGSKTDLKSVVVFPKGQAKTGPVRKWATDAPLVSKADVSVSKKGDAVLATGSVNTGDITALQTEFVTQRGPSEMAPQVNFEFEFRETGSGRGKLTITHAGGDSVAKTNLSLRGSGFADVSGVDQTSPGQWQGSASDEGEVQAGNSVVVGVKSSGEIDLVWRSGESDRTAVLSSWSGPDA